jgi:hypothetical protein
MRRVRIVAGLCCWIAALGLGGWWLLGRGPQSAVVPAARRELGRYALGQRRVAELQFTAPCGAWINDPIFVIEEGRRFRHVGEITAIRAGTTTPYGKAVFYSSAPHFDARAHLTYYETPDSIQWVLNTMLTEEKRQQIAAELRSAFERNQEEIFRLLRPVADQSLRDLLRVVEEDLPPALEHHRTRLQRLADRYQREVVEKDLVPLVRAEVWPIVRQHAQPLAEEIGRELWQRASLLRFGWRYLYDRSPLPEKNLTKQEWDRFVAQDVGAVLEQHQGDFLQLQQQIVAEIARNPRVQLHVRAALTKLAEDADVRRLVEELAEEVVLKNPRVRAEFEKKWRGPEAQEALRASAERFEPTVVKIGEMLLGSAELGISPEFAHVVRSQLLQKDRRWLVLDLRACRPPLTPSGKIVLRVTPGGTAAVNPFLGERGQTR